MKQHLILFGVFVILLLAIMFMTQSERFESVQIQTDENDKKEFEQPRRRRGG